MLVLRAHPGLEVLGSLARVSMGKWRKVRSARLTWPRPWRASHIVDQNQESRSYARNGSEPEVHSSRWRVATATKEPKIAHLSGPSCEIRGLPTRSQVGDRVYILENGMVKYQGAMAAFLGDEEVRRAYLAV
jgi:hypothetical protein